MPERAASASSMSTILMQAEGWRSGSGAIWSMKRSAARGSGRRLAFGTATARQSGDEARTVVGKMTAARKGSHPGPRIQPRGVKWGSRSTPRSPGHRRWPPSLLPQPLRRHRSRFLPLLLLLVMALRPRRCRSWEARNKASSASTTAGMAISNLVTSSRRTAACVI
jgi:hypothetical protein